MDTRKVYEWQYSSRRYFRDESDDARRIIREKAHLSRVASACPFYGKPRLSHHRYLSGLSFLQGVEARIKSA